MSDVPSTASAQPDPVPPAVTDRRPVPRGVLPRGVQTWIMAGVAAGMLAIILIVGRPDPPPRSAQAAAPAQAPSADRVRDYQDRLRLLEAQALREAQTAGVTQPEPAPYADTAPTPVQDPIAEERKRREYESLFASNVVLSRRPERERPDQGRTDPMPGAAPAQTGSPSPSVEEVADAVVRATTRTAGAFGTGAPAAQTAVTPTSSEPRPLDPTQRRTPDYTPPINAAGPLYRVLEGTIIDTVLTNRLDGAMAAPVNCLVTNALYSHTGRQVVVPAGARILGETKPVQAFGEARLAVSFHRLVMPDGRSYRLDQFMGLNQIGDAGLRDKVNNHFLSTFGAAAAVGLISGLSQYLGSAGLGSGDGDRTIVIAGGVGDATSQAAMQVMNRFLNRLPTITIREGHRVKVYLTSDIELPAYAAPVGSRRF
ncbi:MAG: TrbI/VirB10 family protein [Vicinamibacterales bacterium]|jgi:type IV secretion system protein VirB10